MPPQPVDYDIREALHRALERLRVEDAHLFTVGACERSLTFRLGLYLQVEVGDEWRVDSEYNRNGELPKRLEIVKQERLAADPTSASEGDVYPDLIVHRRGERGPNRLAVETKRASQQTRANTQFDYGKLRAYRDDLGYSTVAFVAFGTDERGPWTDADFDL